MGVMSSLKKRTQLTRTHTNDTHTHTHTYTNDTHTHTHTHTHTNTHLGCSVRLLSRGNLHAILSLVRPGQQLHVRHNNVLITSVLFKNTGAYAKVRKPSPSSSPSYSKPLALLLQPQNNPPPHTHTHTRPTQRKNTPNVPQGKGRLHQSRAP